MLLGQSYAELPIMSDAVTRITWQIKHYSTNPAPTHQHTDTTHRHTGPLRRHDELHDNYESRHQASQLITLRSLIIKRKKFKKTSDVFFNILDSCLYHQSNTFLRIYFSLRHHLHPFSHCLKLVSIFCLHVDRNG